MGEPGGEGLLPTPPTTIEAGLQPAQTKRAAIPEQPEAIEPKKPSPTFTKLRETLKKRFEKITQEQTDESSSQEASEIEKRQKESAKKLLSIITTPDTPIFIDEATANTSDGKEIQIDIVVTIKDGKIIILGKKNPDPNDQSSQLLPLSEEEKKINLSPEILAKIISEKLVSHAFTGSTTEQQQLAIAQAVLGQELPDGPQQLAQHRELAHALGYITRDDLAEVLGIPTDLKQREEQLTILKLAYQEAVASQDNNKANTINKKIQEIESIYGNKDGKKPIAEIPEAADVNQVLKIIIGDKIESTRLQDAISTIKNEAEKVAKKNPNLSQQLNQLIKNLEGTDQEAIQSQTLTQLVENYYQALENNETPQFNLAKNLTQILPVYKEKLEIDDKHWHQFENKMKTTGKVAGIFALLMLLMIYKSSQDGQQGQMGGH
ncbi:MAG: hypothetical protein Fur009_7440 [Candidatus Microgenomates bacterium]